MPLSRRSAIIEDGEDDPIPLAHDPYQSSAIFSIFQNSFHGSPTRNLLKHMVTTRSLAEVSLLTKFGREYTIFSYFWQGHRRIEHCKSCQGSPRKARGDLFRSKCDAVLRNVGAGVLHAGGFGSQRSGWSGTGLCKPKEATTVGAKRAGCLTAAFARALQPYIARLYRQERVYSFPGYSKTRISGRIISTCQWGFSPTHIMFLKYLANVQPSRGVDPRCDIWISSARAR